jgi:Na+:H+ antiporter, NhaA family
VSHPSPFKKRIGLLLEFSLPLISGVLLAVAWANLSKETYDATVFGSPFGADSHFNLHFVINDLFMAMFFGIATKEITESCLPGGALNPIKKAINPLMGTLGGVLGPIGVYFLCVSLLGEPAIARGWGIPTATDIALAWLVARMAFGAKHPAVSFLLLLAVADDGIGLGIIAIFYPDPVHPVQPAWLLLVAAASGLAYVLRRRQIGGYAYYLIGPGILSWVGLYFAHLHPALALVPIIPFMPSGARDEGLFAEEGQAVHRPDALNRFEHAFKKPVDLGLFGFGLCNAGVVFSSVGAATWAVLASLIVGKTVGIFTLSSIADRLGFPLPTGMNHRTLLVAGLTASLGLTVALFVANVAFTAPDLQGAAKMGALLSAIAAPLVFLTSRALKIERITVEPTPVTAPEDEGVDAVIIPSTR